MSTFIERANELVDMYDEEYMQQLTNIKAELETIAGSLEDVKEQVEAIAKAIETKKAARSPSRRC